MRFLLSLLLVFAAHSALAASLLPVEIATQKETIPLTLEVVATPKTREIGLMNRDHLAPNGGMLFLFPETKPVAFWMKNTRVPLDMLFIDTSGAITHIAAKATPLSETPIPSAGPVNRVIEIAGGDAARLGIAEGDYVHYQLPKDTHVE